jgi:hypothetical protein
MKRNHKILIAIVAGAVIVSGIIATTALAAPRIANGAGAPTVADYQAWGCPMLGGDYTVITNLLGITVQDLQAQLDQGKSLVEIAAAKNVSENKLVAAILEPMKQFMQQQVTAGNWTQAQLDARLKAAEQHIRQLVEAKGTAAGYGNYSGCGGFGGGMMRGSGGGTTGATGGVGRGRMGGWGRTY